MFRSPDATERDREAAAEASRLAAEAAEIAAAQRALRAPRRGCWIVLAVLAAFAFLAAVVIVYVLSLLASGPAMSGTPGCTLVPERLPDGGVVWVDTCPKPASTR